MTTLYRMATAVALLATAGCTEGVPTEPAEPVMTEARFAELRESAIRIADRIDAAGLITAEDRLEIEAINRELDACVEATAGPPASTAAYAPGTASSPVYGGSPGGTGCLPCPFILSHGNCIGVLRSQGPCRPGAGLERCFYNWYCYGTTG